METISQDFRYGLRSLWNSPGFAIVATLTLALAVLPLRRKSEFASWFFLVFPLLGGIAAWLAVYKPF